MADLLSSFWSSWGSDYPTGESASLRTNPQTSQTQAAASNIVPVNTNYPSNFIGPVKPGDTIGGVNPLKKQGGNVLGTTTTQSSGSGGGGGTHSGGNVNPPAPTPNNQEQALVDSAYSAAMDYLNKAENMVRAYQPQVEQGIQSTYDINQQAANTQKAQGERAIQTATSDVGSRLTSAISAARQALQESLIGGKQRFGSGSNIYKALGEYGTTKFQQAQGSARDTAEKAYSTLQEQAQQLQESFTNSMAQLNQWKTNSLQQAQQEFMNKLMEINSNRSEAEQNKSIQKIQLLQDMRNRADAINNQAWTFAQNLEMQRQAFAQQFGAQTKEFGGTAVGGANQANTNQAQSISNINMTPLSATSNVNLTPYEIYQGRIRRGELTP